jgi:hypothetical protein
MRTWWFLLLLGALFPVAQGQPGRVDSLSIRAAALSDALFTADDLAPDEGMNDSLSNNEVIEHRLKQLIGMPMADSTLERVTEHELLSLTHSNDGRLWSFCWGENNGGSFQRNVCVLLYRDAQGRNLGYADPSICVEGAGVGRIHRLRARKVPGQLYLLEGSVVGCASCLTNVMSVLRVNGDTLEPYYPAFAAAEGDRSAHQGPTPCYSLEARYDHFLQFEYNERKQRIAYGYRTDDLTTIGPEEGSPEGVVRGTLQFDGERFIEKVGPIEPDTFPKR